jgi:hypothetical protein
MVTIAWQQQQKKTYSEHMFFLEIHASALLHSWIMNTEGLRYLAEESLELHFRDIFSLLNLIKLFNSLSFF